MSGTGAGREAPLGPSPANQKIAPRRREGNRRRPTPLLVAVSLFAFSGAIHAARIPAGFVDTQEAALQGHFALAETLASRMTRVEPRDPTGYYARVAISQMQLFGCEVAPAPAVLKRHTEEAVRVGGERVRANPNDVWGRYMYALALGSAASTAADEGSFWAAYRTGTEAISQLEEVLRREPGFADARLALGTYRFWRGAATRNWNWLPFLDDTRAQGINDIRRAQRDGATTTHTAAGMLVWALLREQHWNEALVVSSEITRRYPANRAFLTAHAEALTGLRRWNEAASAWTSVLQTYSLEDVSCGGFVQARANRGIALAEAGRCADAIPDLRAALSATVQDGFGRDFKTLNERSRALLARCAGEGR